MMSETKETHWKGQSRLLKVCHWCTKKQGPEMKPFQACAKCKEVIYCSKECQIASWPLHKTACKFSAQAKAASAGNPALEKGVANLKKWNVRILCSRLLAYLGLHFHRHGSHIAALRHAAICALNLGNNPQALDDGVLFIEVLPKENQEALPRSRTHRIHAGFTLTMAETREMLGSVGGTSLLDNIKEANLHMQKKGGLGIATILVKVYDVVDLVKVVLPSPTAAKLAQDNDNWGEDWLNRLRLVVETD